MHVVIVESPAKSKTLEKYLGKDYKVLASFGHIRDLPSKDGSVDPANDFAMNYEVSPSSSKAVKAIVDAAKGADSIILATDPDREGEAISWHVLEVLRAKKAIKADTKVERVSFNSITKDAVLNAIANPRTLDQNLIDAQQARRALDYLVGFSLSPVLWRKLPGSKSAGRVQSVALRLICDREDEIEKFKEDEYWSIEADFLNKDSKPFQAKLTHYQGEKLEKLSIGNEKKAKEILSSLERASYQVQNVESKQVKRNPKPPFTTSTLQQEAARKLGFGAKKTMTVAQKLYEGINLGGEVTGLITYMRTDGIDVAPEAIHASRDLIEKDYGSNFLPNSPRMYKNKAKNAQEAHEAIRPTSPRRRPEHVAQYLDKDQIKLYELIWKRMIASQMESVVMDQVTADIAANDNKATFRATGSTIKFEGFYALYREGMDDAKKAESDEERILPPLKERDPVSAHQLTPEQHFTQPPPRYSEASLVKKLEELGIGRPSTYAAILSVLQERNYVKLEKRRFTPEPRGRVVTGFLTHYFTRYLEYDFTANLEEQLDSVSAGDTQWKKLLTQFWKDFSANIDEAKELAINDVINELNDRLSYLLFPGEGKIEDRRKCPSCDNGELSLKLGKFGAFVGCSNYPECNFTRKLGGDEEEQNEAEANAKVEPRTLGEDPETGKDITIRKGPYGWYVQVGEAEKGKKPKRQGLPKGGDPATFTLEQAISLLRLPREVGNHPESGKPIVANIGRYGPYLQHDGTFYKLPAEDDVLEVGINRAVTIIAEQKDKPKKGGAKSKAKKAPAKKTTKKKKTG